jgi:hypothetical protein
MQEVYDKAKYHDETVEEYGLSDKHAENHTIFFLRWLIENGLMSAEFMDGSAAILENFQLSKASIHEVYRYWDRCLMENMLSEEGNAFAKSYFDFQRGRYMDDYARTLQGDLPSTYHINYSEKNYQLMKEIIDRRYKAWKNKPWWWPF